ncbi:hypothetical protein [Novipirellula artificiosorum]|uniref:Uncharacterized protein n=1 Tax=Novipirellula artificiosorum TaxID=2528016 RepID=A0A5C6DLP7_9BACT|nr:hypothetical protein [Novipirellula artificiosorum]TWU37054.1 hypothetical protein Poly41_31800 [Novipirellula artificiosorum]
MSGWRNRRATATVRNDRNTQILVALLILLVGPTHAIGESDLRLLLGFDSERIKQTWPADNEDSIGELAKLLYRIDRISSGKLDQIAKSDAQRDARVLGDVVMVAGVIQSIRSIAVPPQLVEFLEFGRIIELRIEQDPVGVGPAITLFTTGLPTAAKSGDRVLSKAMMIAGTQNGVLQAVAAPRVTWLPATPRRVGWQLLSQQGVDLGNLAAVAARNRKPLSHEDTAIFYDLLVAADGIEGSNTAPRIQVPRPASINAVDLLRRPTDFTGEWIQIDLQTIQLTRIEVQDTVRQEQLGADHYYQIDAIGDLGNVVVKIAPVEGSGAEPALFEKRYPVSIVCKTLPAWLRQRIGEPENDDAVVTQLTIPVTVDGFFFRLWSYSSEYMRQFGGGDQFGPLLMAAEIHSREVTDPDPIGVRMIGWIAALATGIAVLGLLVWSFIVARRDREVQRIRKQHEAEHLQLPEQNELDSRSE